MATDKTTREATPPQPAEDDVAGHATKFNGAKQEIGPEPDVEGHGFRVNGDADRTGVAPAVGAEVEGHGSKWSAKQELDPESEVEGHASKWSAKQELDPESEVEGCLLYTSPSPRDS